MEALRGDAEPTSVLAGRAVGLVCAVARPALVRATLEGLGARVVVEHGGPDHAAWSAGELERAAAQAVGAGASVIITTEKDAVRWPAGLALPLPVLALSVEARAVEPADEARLWAAVAGAAPAGKPP